MVHGQFETSCVEGMNNLMKSFVDVRGADPITALRRWIDWDFQYYRRRLDLVLNATGKVTPHMEKILAGQRLALSKYSVTKISNNKRKACVITRQTLEQQVRILISHGVLTAPTHRSVSLQRSISDGALLYLKENCEYNDPQLAALLQANEALQD